VIFFIPLSPIPGFLKPGFRPQAGFLPWRLCRLLGRSERF
jgi:hypothetical protein